MKYNNNAIFDGDAICRTANTLRKRGYTLSQSFVLAWAMAKGTTVKIADTSKLNRQEALRRLTKYSPSETKFILVRESNNAYDENAVAVMVSVRNSKQFKIGYINAYTARIVSGVLDRGLDIKTRLNAIVGVIATIGGVVERYQLRTALECADIRSGTMENKYELITEFVNAFREFAQNEYIAGMRGEPQTELPLPENALREDNIIHLVVCALRRDADLAYKTGQNGEPCELPFSDKYMASIGLIEKKPTPETPS